MDTAVLRTVSMLRSALTTSFKLRAYNIWIHPMQWYATIILEPAGLDLGKDI